MHIQSTAPASGKKITLNLSSDRCLVFNHVIKSDIEDAIIEYESNKINSLWQDFYSEIVIEKEVTYLEGFRSKKTAINGQSFKHLRSSCIKSVLASRLVGVELVQYVQSLPLDGQRHILETCFPRNREEAVETIQNYERKFGEDKLSLLENCILPEDFVNYITYEIFNNQTVTDKETNEYFNLLVKFWSLGLILLPQKVRQLNAGAKWVTICGANSDVQNTIKQLYTTSNKSKSSDRRLAFIATYFATTNTILRDDLSVDLIRKFEEENSPELLLQYQDPKYSAEDVKRPLGDLHKATHYMLLGFNACNPNVAVELSLRRKSTKPYSPRKDLRFSWIADEFPTLSGWITYLYLFICSLDNARVSREITELGHLIEFLGTHENPPIHPWDTSRRLHITDVTLVNQNTFYEYLTSTVSNDAKTLKHTATTIRKFFLWLREYLISEGKLNESRFMDPVLETDSFGRRPFSNRTHRDALPSFLMTDMKEIIVKDDFAFPRSCYRSVITTVDQQSGYSVREFYPGLAICMYTLLEAPIRSHQARWLDSGVFDEKIFNPDTYRSEYNLSPYAIPKRQEGVLQLSSDALRSENWLTMWVNTNKTSVKQEISGYKIPYISANLASLINIQLDWCKRFLPELTAPLSYRYFMQDVREIRHDRNLGGPEVAPLFRDPTGADQKLPLPYYRLSRFYTLLLKETEKRHLAKYGQKIYLTTTNSKGKEVWTVDLHSLRVSGITNLIEAGVPIEIVQQFVAGHKTIVMTLHYLKYSPEKLRIFIEEAHRRMQEDNNFVGSEGFIKAIGDFAPFLLSQGGPGVGPGFEALNMGDGITVINSDGICPGTSCSTGFVIREGSNPIYGPVPGGKRCPLCRYWITGPAHLLGQIAAVNNVGYSIRKKGFEVRRLNELKADAEDCGNQRLARELRDRVDLFNRELDIDVAEWGARYKYAEQSSAQMDEYLKAKENIIVTDSTPHVPMNTPSLPLELKVTLESAHEFALLDQITQMAAFNPGFPNHQAELEKNQVLSKMMVENGMKPFLLSLSEEHAREAGNLLSALVLQQVNSQDLDEVLKGKRPLEDYPFLALALTKLEQISNAEQEFLPAALSALSNLIDTSDHVATPEIDQNDEDMFG